MARAIAWFIASAAGPLPFFVISGYLITRLLHYEVHATARIDLDEIGGAGGP